jgi:hypothetical protein
MPNRPKSEIVWTLTNKAFQQSRAVNTKWLASGGDGEKTFVWAGVLAHELMHNLGHMHGKDEYGDHLQINAVQQLVRTLGEYKKGRHAPGSPATVASYGGSELTGPPGLCGPLTVALCGPEQSRRGTLRDLPPK